MHTLAVAFRHCTLVYLPLELGVTKCFGRGESWFSVMLILCVCSHLSVVGVLSTIGCTYSGFSLLAVAVIWNGNLIKKLGKIREQWRALRGRA